MPIGNQLKIDLKISNVGKLKHEKFQANLRSFQQNRREQEYQSYQRELEFMLQKNM